jgi:hypothetical protein
MNDKTIDPCKKCGSYKRIGINPDFEYWCRDCGTRYRKIDGDWVMILRGKQEKK